MSAPTLSGLLAATAEAHPDRVAVVDGDRRLRYAELDARANRLARTLIESGVSCGDRVGLLLSKSPEAVVAINGVLRAGAAYVPLDPQAPASRLAYIARDAGIAVLVSAAEKAATWPALIAGGAPLRTVIALDAGEPPAHGGPAAISGSGVANVHVRPAAEVEHQPATPPDVAPGPHDLAYILYTSGSTGDPKGVALTHRNALAFVDWAVDAFAVGPADRLSSHAPLHFDLSIFDLFAAVHAGAAVVLVPTGASVFPLALNRFIAEEEISVWYSVPSALSMLVQRGSVSPGSWPRLRTVLFAGEVFAPRYLYALMDLVPHARFYNLYGPTETNVCTYFEVPRPTRSPGGTIPIGRPIAGVDVFVVTDDGDLAAPGEAGELYVRGPTVTQGYWADPEKTARALIPDRLGGSRDRLYRTGDLVRRDERGELWFLGRRDAQIKSRGYRIELGDIESALYEHECVAECAVKAVPDEIVTNRIEAHVVLRAPVGDDQLARFCRERLPSYMVPERFHARAELPRTSTGKVNRLLL
jgi:amino acid adenylation domain-containing protein